MALLPFFLLSLATSVHASPLWSLVRRQQLCNDPDVVIASTLVVPGAQGDVTFTPSQVASTALWILPNATSISNTETIYPFGYVWAPSEPVTLEVPALPSTDVPYPVPENAFETLCPGQPEPTASFISTTTEQTTTGIIAGTTTTEEADTTTGFPDYDPPTTTVSGPEATDDAIHAGPIIFALWLYRDNLQDELKKTEYIQKIEQTRDDVLTLWNKFDVKPEIPGPCGQLSLKKRSLISGIIDTLDDATKLIGCATLVLGNLADKVSIPDPPVDVIITLTDTLKDISDGLEKEKEKETNKPTSTIVSTTDSTTSCVASGVESCTETIYLSTSFYNDGNADTSIVETITTEDCVTITQCDAQPTTEVTTVTTATSSSSPDITCDVDCTKYNAQRRWAEPTLTPQQVHDRRFLAKRMDDMNQPKYDTDEKKDKYILRQISESADKLDWNTITTNVVSIDHTWVDSPYGLSVEGLVGCTGVSIVSDQGGWLAHFMEPGFFYDQNKPSDDATNNGRKDLWDDMMNQLQGIGKVSSKFTPPKGLAVAGGVLAPNNNVQIFVSAPRQPATTFDAPTLLYPDRVSELIGYLTGDSSPFSGIVPTVKTYVKPPGDETDDDMDARMKTARGIMFVEYDDFQQDWVTGEYGDPADTMWRVWQERSYTEHRMAGAAEATPTCARHDDEASGMDPSNANDLARKFCEGSNIDFSNDAELQLGGGDLEPTVELAANVKFSFEKKDGQCSKTCTEIYAEMISTCQYTSHLYTGLAEYDLDCGKYSMDTIPVPVASVEPTATPTTSTEPTATPTPSVVSAPPEVNNCADPTVYTKFTLGQADDAITDFCSHAISLPDAALPVFKTYKQDGVTLQLITQWTVSGLQGCNAPADGINHPELSQSDCEARFNSAVNNCNTDTTSEKYGQRPYTWNSPNGCIDFWIYGDSEDWSCDDLGVLPVPCLNSGVHLD
ncbi:hypothetical protein G7046_g3111 [Stylonectria norvegica]|nr:hypothetical protein G7046_g3111 [Stylonectria norvegica]